MTAPETKSVAVVGRKTPEDKLAESVLESQDSLLRLEAYRLRTEVERRKMIQAAAAEIAGSTWGKGLSVEASNGLARWCYNNGLDPVRHIFILGGRVYDAAEYYKDKLAARADYVNHEEIVIAPLAKVDDYIPKGTEISELALATLRQQVEEENVKRLQLAIKWGVPPDIFQFPKNAAAFLVRLHFSDGNVAEGVNWAGSRGRNKGTQGGSYDPVGDQEPIKTARTRAFRTAAKEKVPFIFQRRGDSRDEALVKVEDVIKQAIDTDRAHPELPPAQVDVQPGLTVSPGSGGAVHMPEDPYAAAGEPTPVPAKAAATDWTKD